MTDKELKQLLKNAYILSESDKSQRFIKEHEKINASNLLTDTYDTYTALGEMWDV